MANKNESSGIAQREEREEETSFAFSTKWGERKERERRLRAQEQNLSWDELEQIINRLPAAARREAALRAGQRLELGAGPDTVMAEVFKASGNLADTAACRLKAVTQNNPGRRNPATRREIAELERTLQELARTSNWKDVLGSGDF